MDNALYYLAINRQVGLRSEMQSIANNIANMATNGYRREGMAFTEHVVAIRNGESVSMADLGARYSSDLPGQVSITGGQFDVAIEGDGFFLLQSGNQSRRQIDGGGNRRLAAVPRSLSGLSPLSPWSPHRRCADEKRIGQAV